MNKKLESPKPRSAAGSFVLSTGFYALMWLGMIGLDNASWVVGGPCVLAAAGAHTALRSSTRLRFSPWGMLYLLVSFLIGSFMGAVDVARRVLAPGLPISPGFHRFPFHVEAGPARLTLILMTNVLPGTLSAKSDGSILTIHSLRNSATLASELRKTETRIARAFKAQLNR